MQSIPQDDGGSPIVRMPRPLELRRARQRMLADFRPILDLDPLEVDFNCLLWNMPHLFADVRGLRAEGWSFEALEILLFPYRYDLRELHEPDWLTRETYEPRSPEDRAVLEQQWACMAVAELLPVADEEDDASDQRSVGSAVVDRAAELLVPLAVIDGAAELLAPLDEERIERLAAALGLAGSVAPAVNAVVRERAARRPEGERVTTDDGLPPELSESNRDILTRWRAGQGAPQIAVALSLAPRSVRTSISRLRSKYGDRVVPYHPRYPRGHPENLL
jgi:hypothetical protein